MHAYIEKIEDALFSHDLLSESMEFCYGRKWELGSGSLILDLKRRLFWNSLIKREFISPFSHGTKNCLN